MDLISNVFPLLIQGMVITVILGVISFIIGSVLGFLIMVARVFGPAPLRAIAIGYVSIIRGTPLLVQILLIYFGLPQIGIQLEAIPSSILALSLHTAAYMSEDFRSGFLAVDKGQWEAAYALGMPFSRAIRRIILPQAVRVFTPSAGSRFISLIKDTSLASVVTVVELTRVAEQVGSSTFRYMEMFFIIAAIYWLVNLLLSIGQEGLERRMRRAY